jgi:hypothetical protein
MLPGTIHARLAPRAAVVTRRGSLCALGSAALTAMIGALPDRAAGKKKRKGKGTSCQERERQRCTSDVDACKATVLAYCPEQGTCDDSLICCEACTATGFLRCFLGGT